MNYPLKPFFNRVLLKRELAEEKTKSGLIINTETTIKKNAPSIGIVLDVGETCDDPIKNLIGKRVLFSRFAGDWITLPGVKEEYFICSDEDILGEIIT